MLYKITEHATCYITWNGHDSLLGQRTYSVKKNVFIKPQVIFAIPAKEQFAGACAILVVCQ